MATYLALTTLNSQTSGWSVLAYGEGGKDMKARVEEAARAQIGDIRTDYGTDIYAETKHKNLRVVSKTTAKRKYGIDFDKPEHWWRKCRDAEVVR